MDGFPVRSDGDAFFDLDRLHRETFVRTVDYHRQIDSTNQRALELLAAGTADLPLLVLAEQQTAGRGRGSNVWWSGDGSLTFSIVLDSRSMPLSAENWPKVSLTAGLAVCRALAHLVPAAQIGLKWPNDVYVNGRKVCGLLVEVPSSRDGRLVLGIGINVNNSIAGAPDGLHLTATSLVDTAGAPHDLTDVLVLVMQRLAEELAQLVAEDGRLLRAWKTYCLLEGRSVSLQVGPTTADGTCLGIDADGALLIQTSSGLQRFLSGCITHFE